MWDRMICSSGIGKTALVEPVVAGARDEERSRLLPGPPGVVAQLLVLTGLDADRAAAPIPPDPSFAILHRLYWICGSGC